VGGTSLASGGAAARFWPARPLADLVLGALDLDAHLLAKGAGDKAPDAVILPVSGLGNLGQGYALLAAQ
jgi:hypothetical protein